MRINLKVLKVLEVLWKSFVCNKLNNFLDLMR